MKKLLIAAVATLGVATSVLAQGVPPATSAPMYGSRAFPSTPYEPTFSKLFAGHKNNTKDTSVNNDASNTSTLTTGS